MKYLISALLLCCTPVWAAIDSGSLPPVKALQQHSEKLLSAGLPQPAEIKSLASAGVDVVIDLIPTGKGLDNEAQLTEQAGLSYYQIAVDWQQPTEANFDQFRQLMRQHSTEDVLVHCQANYRASAFVYLYQLVEFGQDDLTALAPWGDLEQSFSEYPQWQRLIETIKAKNQ